VREGVLCVEATAGVGAALVETGGAGDGRGAGDRELAVPHNPQILAPDDTAHVLREFAASVPHKRA
jgi:hypothetical protein